MTMEKMKQDRFAQEKKFFVTDPKALVELPIGIDSFAWENDNTQQRYAATMADVIIIQAGW